tara:strand:+ start:166 stop:804 length:639 start_codon:yes stop_codon:yes gene_type:complete
MNQNSYIGEDQFLKFLGEKSAAEGGDYRGRAYQGFGIPFVQAKKNLSPFSSVTEGVGVLKDQFMSGQLGNFFADANPILGMATGQPMNLGDETGSASISPGGGFQLAGKYSSFGVNPFMREVSGSLTNKRGNLTVGGRFSMGPQGAYDPTVQLNIRAGDPFVPPTNRIDIQGLPQQEMSVPSVSPGRALMDQTVDQYRNENPFYYRSGVGAY